MEEVLKIDSWTSLRGGANGGKVRELETLEDVYYPYYEQKTENNDLKPGYVIHSILGGLSLFQEKKNPLKQQRNIKESFC